MTRTYALFAAALSFGATAATAQAAFVYSSQVGNHQAPGILLCADPDETNSRIELPGTPDAREFDAQQGDAITLGGTDRFVTAFEVRIAAFQPFSSALSTDVELNVYTNVGGLPGALLWTGTSAGVVLPSSSLGVDVTFSPNITVPDSLVFSVAFANISNPGHRSLGVATTSVVFVGSSPATILSQNTQSQAWRTEFYGSTFSHVQARITAVPAPASAIALGAALLHPRRRCTPRTRDGSLR